MDTSVNLSTGAKLPLLGLGDIADETALKLALRTALDFGYRLIDTAQVHGNEAIIGDVLREFFSSGKLKREDILITTKLLFYVCEPEDVEKYFDRQFNDLQLDYAGFYFFHCPCMTEVERHIYWPQHGPFELCKKHGITFTACVFLGFPARTDCVPGHKWPEGKPLKDKSVLELPKENGKTPAQVLIRHLIQRGMAAIPKGTRPERVCENCNVLDFKLTDDEMHKLNNMSTKVRLCPFQW
ncbi:unnamed protein product [Enterobius vermicularis]|uniref:Aldo_ket_red domain-containing protein n=1 Tax=Enterobius vermicularis TaxID=51028 RepID=A0A0N4V6R8_ENTVE|nr:unnamed protein product [Enterobius vermicularis]